MLCSLYNNSIGDKGASALAAVLKETQITTLKCAAASECSFFVSAPADRKANTLWQPSSLISPSQPLSVLLISSLCALVSQCRLQRHHGRRSRPSSQCGARARHHDRLLRDPARLLAPEQHHGARPVPSRVQKWHRRAWSYRAEQVAPLCGGGQVAQVRHRNAKCLLLCQRPLTRLLSHRSYPAPRLQYWGQRHRSRGRLRARRHPQGDADHHPGVSHRPRLFAFVSAPIDTHSFSFPWQLGRQPALRRRSLWRRHLHH